MKRRIKKAEEKKGSGRVLPEGELSTAAKKLIRNIDQLEVNIEDLREEMSGKLNELLGEMPFGIHTFEHPDRGPMTVMKRKNLVFWRGKPKGLEGRRKAA